MLWREERGSNAELFAARRAARQVTGLTLTRINQWEDAGHDSSDWPGLDLKARELARLYPALAIGPGYTSDGGEDQTDYAGHLWEVLRERDERTRPRHDADLLRRAAELVVSCPAGDGTDFGPMRFSAERWACYLARKGIPWPRLPSGALALDDETFREMARAYPADVSPIRELRHTLSQLRLNELAVGADGRNRCLLSAFGAKTGRNTPSNSRFAFGPSTWLRSLIRPAPGRAVAYVEGAPLADVPDDYLARLLHRRRLGSELRESVEDELSLRRGYAVRCLGPRWWYARRRTAVADTERKD